MIKRNNEIFDGDNIYDFNREVTRGFIYFACKKPERQPLLVDMRRGLNNAHKKDFERMVKNARQQIAYERKIGKL